MFFAVSVFYCYIAIVKIFLSSSCCNFNKLVSVAEYKLSTVIINRFLHSYILNTDQIHFKGSCIWRMKQSSTWTSYVFPFSFVTFLFDVREAVLKWFILLIRKWWICYNVFMLQHRYILSKSTSTRQGVVWLTGEGCLFFCPSHLQSLFRVVTNS